MNDYQTEVVAEIRALADIQAIDAFLATAAVDVVSENEGNTFAESSGMGSSEGADLALDLARIKSKKIKKAATAKDVADPAPKVAKAPKAKPVKAPRAAKKMNAGKPPKVEAAPVAPAVVVAAEVPVVIPIVSEASPPKVKQIEGAPKPVTLVEHAILGICQALTFHKNGDVDVIDSKGETWRITGGENK